MSGDEPRPAFRMSPPSDLGEGQTPDSRVEAPANALLIVVVLALLVNCLGCPGVLYLFSNQGAAARPEGMSDEDYAVYRQGRYAGSFLQTCAIVVLTLLIYPVALLGAVRMRQLRGYSLAVTGAVLVMLPCSLMFVIGLPVGIWALTTLRDPAVKGAFR